MMDEQSGKMNMQPEIEENEGDETWPGHGGVNVALLPFKLYFLTYFLAFYALYPYKTLFFKQIGMSSSEAGYLLAVIPISSILFTSPISSLADKLQRRKLFCLIGTAAWSLMIFFLSNTPERSSTIMECKNPQNYSFETSRNHAEISEMDSSSLSTFVYVLIVSIIGGVIGSVSSVTATTLTLQNIRKYEDFGYQFVYSSVGYLISSLLVGSLLHFCRTTVINSCGEEIITTNYKVSLYIAASLFAVSFATVFFFKEHKSKDNNIDTGNVWSNLYKGLTPEIFYLLCVCFFIGSAMAGIHAFLFWHLSDLGATQSLFLLVTVMNAIGQFAANVSAKFLIEKIGHMPLIFVSILSSTIRFTTYVFLSNPWYVLFVELLDGTMTSLFIVVAVSYIGLVPGAGATAQSLIQTFVYGIGFSTGSMLGGIIVKHIGIVQTFGFFSCFSVVVLILFGVCVNFGPSSSKKNLDESHDSGYRRVDNIEEE